MRYEIHDLLEYIPDLYMMPACFRDDRVGPAHPLLGTQSHYSDIYYLCDQEYVIRKERSCSPLLLW